MKIIYTDASVIKTEITTKKYVFVIMLFFHNNIKITVLNKERFYLGEIFSYIDKEINCYWANNYKLSHKITPYIIKKMKTKFMEENGL